MTARVGIFGHLGAGNIGNDAAMASVLGYLRSAHPEVTLDAMCRGPERVSAEYGIAATAIDWKHPYASRTLEGRARQGAAGRRRGWRGLPAVASTALGKAVDACRIASWVRRHDVVVVPGAGVLESTLPMRPWETPYALFVLGVAGRVFRTDVALVSVGATAITQPATRWLNNATARLATYRSYRDTLSRDAMAARGQDVSRDPVYADLVFGLPGPEASPEDADLVGVGVMTYYGSNDDRRQSRQLHASYEETMHAFVRWLVDSGFRVRLFVGDECDDAVVRQIVADVRQHRPDLDGGRVVAEPVTTWEELTRAVAPVGTVVATRYHNVVCALKLGKPTISIGYSEKNAVLMADMGLGEYCQSASAVDLDRLTAQFEELRRRAPALRRRVAQGAVAHRGLVERQFTELSDVVASAGAGAPGSAHRRTAALT